MKKARTSFLGSLAALLVSCVLTFSSVSVSAGNTCTYSQYLADYLASNELAQTYVNRDYQIPYRKFVEDCRDSTVYQGLLASWELLTFDGKAADQASKAVGFYETIPMTRSSAGSKVIPC